VTDTYGVLSQTQLPNAVAAQYTVPGATQAIVGSIILVNTDSAPHTVSLFVNGSAAANKILDSVTIAANTRIELNATMTLNATNTIQGVADVAAKVTMTVFGLQIS
jgi:hypothetical protein